MMEASCSRRTLFELVRLQSRFVLMCLFLPMLCLQSSLRRDWLPTLNRNAMMRSSVLLVAYLSFSTLQAADFRVLPYVQNPTVDSMTVRWLSESATPGTLTVETPEGPREFTSKPVQATALAYNPFKEEPCGPHPGLPWMHSVRVDQLKPASEYNYSVVQGAQSHTASFQTSARADEAVRLIVYSDSETEPESSTCPPVAWPVNPGSNRPEGIVNYLVNQTTGYQENCRIIAERRPDLLLIVGDLVECGGEQRDWDEFWRHNAGEFGALASRIPIIPSLGNHENFGGPGGGYSADGANFGTDKFLTYFETPDNNSTNPKHKGRYYRLDYGPVTLICVDSSDGLPNETAADTNHSLQGSNAPDFNPGSEQYRWLEMQLADAQTKSRFTFVQFHHTMFGSGPHSVPFGQDGFSGQSGIAMRVLLPLLMKYGVDLVFSGHDEMLERSFVEGEEVRPDGAAVAHSIHFYDVGIGGDGLRGPSKAFDNPHRKFLAHDDVPEVWENGRLISGGKHYGHLEVDVKPQDSGEWAVEVTPVHIFPIVEADGKVSRWERRAYADGVTISAKP